MPRKALNTAKQSVAKSAAPKKNISRTARNRPDRNADQTRARIIQAAIREFSRNGFAGARMSDIVASAGVNVSLAYQYFGDKESLFIRAMEEAYLIMRRSHREFELRNKSPAEAMEELVRSTFRLFLEHPELIGLLNAENLNEAHFVRNSLKVKGMYDPLIETIREILQRGQEQGIYRLDVDPVELFITINAVGYFYLSNKYTLGYILHQDLTDSARIIERESHIVDVIFGYLRYNPISN